MTDTTKPEVLLVDLSGLFWRSWMSNGETLKARDNTLALVRRCMEGSGFQAPVALCLDKGKSFRKDLLPEYKGNRPEKDLMAIDELRRTEAALADEGFTSWGADGFEADDIIATATQKAVAAGHPVKIVSDDKDLLQLLSVDGVSVLRPRTMRTWRAADVMAENEYGIPPYLLGDWLALTGDSSDNVPGCPGIGPKSATGFLRAFPGLGHLFDAAKAGSASKALVRGAAKLAQAIVQNEEGIRLARKLVELRFDAPINFDEIYKPRERKRPTNQPDQENEMEAKNEIDAGNEVAPAAPAPAPSTPTPVPSATAVPPAATAAAEQTKQIAVITPEIVGPFEMALEPRNAQQAMNMAKALWRSGLYGKFPNEEAVYAVITRGRELGVGALASLDLFHFFEGKLALHAHFIRHLAQSDPACEWFLPMPASGDDPAKVARWATKHRAIPEPIFHTYTIEMAVDAGLCEMEIKPRDWTKDRDGKVGKDHRGNWDKRRPEMLDKTCSSQLARRVYPGRSMGLYSLAELGGDEA